MGSIVSMFSGPAAVPQPETPAVAAVPVTPEPEEEAPGSEENRRKRAEERRRTLAQLAGGQSSTIHTTPLGAAGPAKAGAGAADAAASVAASPRKSTLG